MKDRTLKVSLTIIACGIWILVLQNAGIIPTQQRVKVTNRVDAYVHGTVSIDNTVDVNLDAINGQGYAFYDFGGNKRYVRIPVYTGGY